MESYTYDDQGRLTAVKGGVSFTATYGMNQSQDQVLLNETDLANLASNHPDSQLAKDWAMIQRFRNGNATNDDVERLKELIDSGKIVLKKNGRKISSDEINKDMNFSGIRIDKYIDKYDQDLYGDIEGVGTGIDQYLDDADDLLKLSKGCDIDEVFGDEVPEFVEDWDLIRRFKEGADASVSCSGSDFSNEEISRLEKIINDGTLKIIDSNGNRLEWDGEGTFRGWLDSINWNNVECRYTLHGVTYLFDDKGATTMDGKNMSSYIQELNQRQTYMQEGKTTEGYQLGTMTGIDMGEETHSLFELAEMMGGVGAMGSVDIANDLGNILSGYNLVGLDTIEPGQFVATSASNGGIMLQFVEVRRYSEYRIINGKPLAVHENFVSVGQPQSFMREVADYQVYDEEGKQILDWDLTDGELNQFIYGDEDGDGIVTIRGVKVSLNFSLTEEGYTDSEIDAFEDGTGSRVLNTKDSAFKNLSEERKEALMFGGGTFLAPEVTIDGKTYDISSFSEQDLIDVFNGDKVFALDGDELKIVESNSVPSGWLVLDLDRIFVSISMEVDGTSSNMVKVSLADLLYENKHSDDPHVKDDPLWKQKLAYFIMSRQIDYADTSEEEQTRFMTKIFINVVMNQCSIEVISDGSSNGDSILLTEDQIIALLNSDDGKIRIGSEECAFKITFKDDETGDERVIKTNKEYFYLLSYSDRQKLLMGETSLPEVFANVGGQKVIIDLLNSGLDLDHIRYLIQVGGYLYVNKETGWVTTNDHSGDDGWYKINWEDVKVTLDIGFGSESSKVTIHASALYGNGTFASFENMTCSHEIIWFENPETGEKFYKEQFTKGGWDPDDEEAMMQHLRDQNGGNWERHSKEFTGLAGMLNYGSDSNSAAWKGRHLMALNVASLLFTGMFIGDQTNKADNEGQTNRREATANDYIFKTMVQLRVLDNIDKYFKTHSTPKGWDDLMEELEEELVEGAFGSSVDGNSLIATLNFHGKSLIDHLLENVDALQMFGEKDENGDQIRDGWFGRAVSKTNIKGTSEHRRSTAIASLFGAKFKEKLDPTGAHDFDPYDLLEASINSITSITLGSDKSFYFKTRKEVKMSNELTFTFKDVRQHYDSEGNLMGKAVNKYGFTFYRAGDDSYERFVYDNWEGNLRNNTSNKRIPGFPSLVDGGRPAYYKNYKGIEGLTGYITSVTYTIETYIMLNGQAYVSKVLTKTYMNNPIESAYQYDTVDDKPVFTSDANATVIYDIVEYTYGETEDGEVYLKSCEGQSITKTYSVLGWPKEDDALAADLKFELDGEIIESGDVYVSSVSVKTTEYEIRGGQAVIIAESTVTRSINVDITKSIVHELFAGLEVEDFEAEYSLTLTASESKADKTYTYVGNYVVGAIENTDSTSYTYSYKDNNTVPKLLSMDELSRLAQDENLQENVSVKQNSSTWNLKTYITIKGTLLIDTETNVDTATDIREGKPSNVVFYTKDEDGELKQIDATGVTGDDFIRLLEGQTVSIAGENYTLDDLYLEFKIHGMTVKMNLGEMQDALENDYVLFGIASGKISISILEFMQLVESTPGNNQWQQMMNQIEQNIQENPDLYKDANGNMTTYMEGGVLMTDNAFMLLVYLKTNPGNSNARKAFEHYLMVNLGSETKEEAIRQLFGVEPLYIESWDEDADDLSILPGEAPPDDETFYFGHAEGNIDGLKNWTGQDHGTRSDLSDAEMMSFWNLLTSDDLVNLITGGTVDVYGEPIIYRPAQLRALQRHRETTDTSNIPDGVLDDQLQDPTKNYDIPDENVDWNQADVGGLFQGELEIPDDAVIEKPEPPKKDDRHWVVKALDAIFVKPFEALIELVQVIIDAIQFIIDIILIVVSEILDAIGLDFLADVVRLVRGIIDVIIDAVQVVVGFVGWLVGGIVEFIFGGFVYGVDTAWGEDWEFEVVHMTRPLVESAERVADAWANMWDSDIYVYEHYTFNMDGLSNGERPLTLGDIEIRSCEEGENAFAEEEKWTSSMTVTFTKYAYSAFGMMLGSKASSITISYEDKDKDGSLSIGDTINEFGGLNIEGLEEEGETGETFIEDAKVAVGENTTFSFGDISLNFADLSLMIGGGFFKSGADFKNFDTSQFNEFSKKMNNFGQGILSTSSPLNRSMMINGVSVKIRDVTTTKSINVNKKWSEEDLATGEKKMVRRSEITITIKVREQVSSYDRNGRELSRSVVTRFMTIKPPEGVEATSISAPSELYNMDLGAPVSKALPNESDAKALYDKGIQSYGVTNDEYELINGQMKLTISETITTDISAKFAENKDGSATGPAGDFKESNVEYKELLNENDELMDGLVTKDGDVLLTKEEVMKYLEENSKDANGNIDLDLLKENLFKLIDAILMAGADGVNFNFKFDEGDRLAAGSIDSLMQGLLQVIFDGFNELTTNMPSITLSGYLNEYFNVPSLNNEQKELIINAMILEAGDLGEGINLFVEEEGEIVINEEIFEDFDNMDFEGDDDGSKKDAFKKKIITALKQFFANDEAFVQKLEEIENSDDPISLSDVLVEFKLKFSRAKTEAINGNMENFENVALMATTIGNLVQTALNTNDIDFANMVAEAFMNLSNIATNAQMECLRNTAKIMIKTLAALVKKMGALAKKALKGDKDALKNLGVAMKLLKLIVEIADKYSSEDYLNLNASTFESAANNASQVMSELNQIGDSLFDFGELADALGAKDENGNLKAQKAFEKAVEQLGEIMQELTLELEKSKSNWDKIALYTEYARTVFEASTLIGDTVIMLSKQSNLDVFKMSQTELNSALNQSDLAGTDLAANMNGLDLQGISNALGEELKAVIDILNNKGEKASGIQNDFYYKRLNAHVNMGHAYLAMMKVSTKVLAMVKAAKIQGKLSNLGNALQGQMKAGKMSNDLKDALAELGLGGEGDAGKGISLKVLNHYLSKMNQLEEELSTAREEAKAALGEMEELYDFIEQGLREGKTYQDILNEIKADPELSAKFGDVNSQVGLITLKSKLEHKMREKYKTLTEKAKDLRKVADDMNFMVNVLEKLPETPSDTFETIESKKEVKLTLMITDPVTDEMFQVDVSGQGFNIENTGEVDTGPRGQAPPAGGTWGVEDSTEEFGGETPPEESEVSSSATQYSVTQTYDRTEYSYDKDGILTDVKNETVQKSYSYAIFKTWGAKSFDPNAANPIPEMDEVEAGGMYMTSITYIEKEFDIIKGESKLKRETKTTYSFNTDSTDYVDPTDPNSQKIILADKGYRESQEMTVYEYDEFGKLIGAKGRVLKLNTWKVVGNAKILMSCIDDSNKSENYILYVIIGGQAREVERSVPELKFGENDFKTLALLFNDFLKEHIGEGKQDAKFYAHLDEWFNLLMIPEEDRAALREEIVQMLKEGRVGEEIEELIATTCPWATYEAELQNYIKLYSLIFNAFEVYKNTGQLPAGFAEDLKALLSLLGVEVFETITAELIEAIESGDLETVKAAMEKFQGTRMDSYVGDDQEQNEEDAGNKIKKLVELLMDLALNKDALKDPEHEKYDEVMAKVAEFVDLLNSWRVTYSDFWNADAGSLEGVPPLLNADDVIELMKNGNISDLGDLMVEYGSYDYSYTVTTTDSNSEGESTTTTTSHTGTVEKFGTAQVHAGGMLLKHLKELYIEVRDAIVNGTYLTDARLEELFIKLRIPTGDWDKYKKQVRDAIAAKNLSWLETESDLGWNQFIPESATGGQAADITGFEYLGKDPKTGKDIYRVKFKTNDFASAILERYSTMVDGEKVVQGLGKGGSKTISKSYTFYDGDGNVIGKYDNVYGGIWDVTSTSETMEGGFHFKETQTRTDYIMINGEALVSRTETVTEGVPLNSNHSLYSEDNVTVVEYFYEVNEEGQGVLVNARGFSSIATTTEDGGINVQYIEDKYAIVYGKAVIVEQIVRAYEEQTPDNKNTKKDESYRLAMYTVREYSYDEGGRQTGCEGTVYQDGNGIKGDRNLDNKQEIARLKVSVKGIQNTTAVGTEEWVIIAGEAKLLNSDKHIEYSITEGRSRTDYDTTTKVENTYDRKGRLISSKTTTDTTTTAHQLDSGYNGGIAASYTPSREVKEIVTDRAGRTVSEKTLYKKESNGDTTFEADCGDLSGTAWLGKILGIIIKVICKVIGEILPFLKVPLAIVGSVLSNIVENLCAHGFDSDYWGDDFWLKVMICAAVAGLFAYIGGEIGGGGEVAEELLSSVGEQAGEAAAEQGAEYAVEQIAETAIGMILSAFIDNAVAFLIVYVIVEVIVTLLEELLVKVLTKVIKEAIKDSMRDENGELSKEDVKNLNIIMGFIDLGIQIGIMVISGLLSSAVKGTVQGSTDTSSAALRDGARVEGGGTSSGLSTGAKIGRAIKRNLGRTFTRGMLLQTVANVLSQLTIIGIQASIASSKSKKEDALKAKYEEQLSKAKTKKQKKLISQNQAIEMQQMQMHSSTVSSLMMVMSQGINTIFTLAFCYVIPAYIRLSEIRERAENLPDNADKTRILQRIDDMAKNPFSMIGPGNRREMLNIEREIGLAEIDQRLAALGGELGLEISREGNHIVFENNSGDTHTMTIDQLRTAGDTEFLGVNLNGGTLRYIAMCYEIKDRYAEDISYSQMGNMNADFGMLGALHTPVMKGQKAYSDLEDLRSQEADIDRELTRLENDEDMSQEEKTERRTELESRREEIRQDIESKERIVDVSFGIGFRGLMHMYNSGLHRSVAGADAMRELGQDLSLGVARAERLDSGYWDKVAGIILDVMNLDSRVSEPSATSSEETTVQPIQVDEEELERSMQEIAQTTSEFDLTSELLEDTQAMAREGLLSMQNILPRDFEQAYQSYVELNSDNDLGVMPPEEGAPMRRKVQFMQDMDRALDERARTGQDLRECEGYVQTMEQSQMLQQDIQIAEQLLTINFARMQGNILNMSRAQLVEIRLNAVQCARALKNILPKLVDLLKKLEKDPNNKELRKNIETCTESLKLIQDIAAYLGQASMIILTRDQLRAAQANVNRAANALFQNILNSEDFSENDMAKLDAIENLARVLGGEDGQALERGFSQALMLQAELLSELADEYGKDNPDWDKIRTLNKRIKIAFKAVKLLGDLALFSKSFAEGVVGDKFLTMTSAQIADKCSNFETIENGFGSSVEDLNGLTATSLNELSEYVEDLLGHLNGVDSEGNQIPKNDHYYARLGYLASSARVNFDFATKVSDTMTALFNEMGGDQAINNRIQQMIQNIARNGGSLTNFGVVLNEDGTVGNEGEIGNGIRVLLRRFRVTMDNLGTRQREFHVRSQSIRRRVDDKESEMAATRTLLRRKMDGEPGIDQSVYAILRQQSAIESELMTLYAIAENVNNKQMKEIGIFESFASFRTNFSRSLRTYEDALVRKTRATASRREIDTEITRLENLPEDQREDNHSEQLETLRNRKQELNRVIGFIDESINMSSESLQEMNSVVQLMDIYSNFTDIVDSVINDMRLLNAGAKIRLDVCDTINKTIDNFTGVIPEAVNRELDRSTSREDSETIRNRRQQIRRFYSRERRTAILNALDNHIRDAKRLIQVSDEEIAGRNFRRTRYAMEVFRNDLGEDSQSFINARNAMQEYANTLVNIRNEGTTISDIDRTNQVNELISQDIDSVDKELAGILFKKRRARNNYTNGAAVIGQFLRVSMIIRKAFNLTNTVDAIGRAWQELPQDDKRRLREADGFSSPETFGQVPNHQHIGNGQSMVTIHQILQSGAMNRLLSNSENLFQQLNSRGYFNSQTSESDINAIHNTYTVIAALSDTFVDETQINDQVGRVYNRIITHLTVVSKELSENASAYVDPVTDDTDTDARQPSRMREVEAYRGVLLRTLTGARPFASTAAYTRMLETNVGRTITSMDNNMSLSLGLSADQNASYINQLGGLLGISLMHNGSGDELSYLQAEQILQEYLNIPQGDTEARQRFERRLAEVTGHTGYGDLNSIDSLQNIINAARPSWERISRGQGTEFDRRLVHKLTSFVRVLKLYESERGQDIPNAENYHDANEARRDIWNRINTMLSLSNPDFQMISSLAQQSMNLQEMISIHSQFTQLNPGSTNPQVNNLGASFLGLINQTGAATSRMLNSRDRVEQNRTPSSVQRYILDRNTMDQKFHELNNMGIVVNEEIQAHNQYNQMQFGPEGSFDDIQNGGDGKTTQMQYARQAMRAGDYRLATNIMNNLRRQYRQTLRPINDIMQDTTLSYEQRRDQLRRQIERDREQALSGDKPKDRLTSMLRLEHGGLVLTVIVRREQGRSENEMANDSQLLSESIRGIEDTMDEVIETTQEDRNLRNAGIIYFRMTGMGFQNSSVSTNQINGHTIPGVDFAEISAHRALPGLESSIQSMMQRYERGVIVSNLDSVDGNKLQEISVDLGITSDLDLQDNIQRRLNAMLNGTPEQRRKAMEIISRLREEGASIRIERGANSYYNRGLVNDLRSNLRLDNNADAQEIMSALRTMLTSDNQADKNMAIGLISALTLYNMLDRGKAFSTPSNASTENREAIREGNRARNRLFRVQNGRIRGLNRRIFGDRVISQSELRNIILPSGNQFRAAMTHVNAAKALKELDDTRREFEQEQGRESDVETVNSLAERLRNISNTDSGLQLAESVINSLSAYNIMANNIKNLRTNTLNANDTSDYEESMEIAHRNNYFATRLLLSEGAGQYTAYIAEQLSDFSTTAANFADNILDDAKLNKREVRGERNRETLRISREARAEGMEALRNADQSTYMPGRDGNPMQSLTSRFSRANSFLQIASTGISLIEQYRKSVETARKQSRLQSRINQTARVQTPSPQGAPGPVQTLEDNRAQVYRRLDGRITQIENQALAIMRRALALFNTVKVTRDNERFSDNNSAITRVANAVFKIGSDLLQKAQDLDRMLSRAGFIPVTIQIDENGVITGFAPQTPPSSDFIGPMPTTMPGLSVNQTDTFVRTLNGFLSGTMSLTEVSSRMYAAEAAMTRSNFQEASPELRASAGWRRTPEHGRYDTMIGGGESNYLDAMDQLNQGNYAEAERLFKLSMAGYGLADAIRIYAQNEKRYDDNQTVLTREGRRQHRNEQGERDLNEDINHTVRQTIGNLRDSQGRRVTIPRYSLESGRNAQDRAGRAIVIGVDAYLRGNISVAEKQTKIAVANLEHGSQVLGLGLDINRIERADETIEALERSLSVAETEYQDSLNNEDSTHRERNQKREIVNRIRTQLQAARNERQVLVRLLCYTFIVRNRAIQKSEDALQRGNLEASGRYLAVNTALSLSGAISTLQSAEGLGLRVMSLRETANNADLTRQLQRDNFALPQLEIEVTNARQALATARAGHATKGGGRVVIQSEVDRAEERLNTAISRRDATQQRLRQNAETLGLAEVAKRTRSRFHTDLRNLRPEFRDEQGNLIEMDVDSLGEARSSIMSQSYDMLELMGFDIERRVNEDGSETVVRVNYNEEEVDNAIDRIAESDDSLLELQVAKAQIERDAQLIYTGMNIMYQQAELQVTLNIANASITAADSQLSILNDSKTRINNQIDALTSEIDGHQGNNGDLEVIYYFWASAVGAEQDVDELYSERSDKRTQLRQTENAIQVIENNQVHRRNLVRNLQTAQSELMSAAINQFRAILSVDPIGAANSRERLDQLKSHLAALGSINSAINTIGNMRSALIRLNQADGAALDRVSVILVNPADYGTSHSRMEAVLGETGAIERETGDVEVTWGAFNFFLAYNSSDGRAQMMSTDRSDPAGRQNRIMYETAGIHATDSNMNANQKRAFVFRLATPQAIEERSLLAAASATVASRGAGFWNTVTFGLVDRNDENINLTDIVRGGNASSEQLALMAKAGVLDQYLGARQAVEQREREYSEAGLTDGGGGITQAAEFAREAIEGFSSFIATFRATDNNFEAANAAFNGARAGGMLAVISRTKDGKPNSASLALERMNRVGALSDIRINEARARGQQYARNVL
ncbi:hypothetical protein BVX93_02255, partial [bacterium B13(2017)]